RAGTGHGSASLRVLSYGVGTAGVTFRASASRLLPCTHAHAHWAGAYGRGRARSIGPRSGPGGSAGGPRAGGFDQPHRHQTDWVRALPPGLVRRRLAAFVELAAPEQGAT